MNKQLLLLELLANEVKDAVIAEIVKDNIVSITGAVVKRAKNMDLSSIIQRYTAAEQVRNDSNARYIIGELLDAVRSLNYQENGRWYSGVHGDSDVSEKLDWPVSLAEEWLRQTKQKGGDF